MSRVLSIAGVFLVTAYVCGVPAVAQTSNSADTSNKSWTSTSFLKDPAGTANPTRMTESHTENNGHIVDKRKLERLGPGGQYVPYLEIERETIRVNSSTTKTVERSYGTNADGGRTLVQETSEEQQKLSGGGEKFLRSVSNPDGNGSLRVVQQETRQSRTTGAGVNETDSTVLLPDMNGSLSPSRMTHLREQKKSDELTVYKQTESLPDGNGGWRVSEVREGKITGKVGEQVKEENASHADLDGRLSVDQRTVTKEEKAAGGQKRKVAETYSAVSPGNTPDGMQVTERVITVNKNGVGGEKSTVQQVQGRNLGDPNAGMRTTSETIDIVRPGAGGTSRQEQTVKAVGSDGSLAAVWVDMGKAQDTTPVTVDTKKTAAKSASSSKSSALAPSTASQTKTK